MATSGPAAAGLSARAARAARRSLTAALSLVLAAGGLALGPAALTPASAADGDFTCGSNVIYGTYSSNGTTTNLYRIDAGTGASTTVGSFPASVNALAIARNGNAAYAITNPATAAGQASLYKYGTAGVFKTLTGLTPSAGIPGGSFNPVTGDYWFSTVSAPTGDNTKRVFSFYKVDVSSAASTVNFTSPTLTYTASTGNASVGTDFVFDSRGRMYLVVSTDSTAYDNQLLTFTAAQVAAGGSQTPVRMVYLDAGSATTTFPGVAFGSSGHLYTQGGTRLYKSNPTTGDAISNSTTSVGFTDLGSCANPTIVDAVRKRVVDRKNPTDRFTLSLSGGSFSAPVTAVAATPATGLQNEQVSAAVVLPNTTYTIAETAANGADLANYVSTWSCVDEADDSVIASGTGATGTFTTPDTVATGQGAALACTFTNEVKNPGIEITKNASGSPTRAGDTISYSFTVTNTGNRPLTGIAVTDPLLGSTPITCAATSLAPGASTTCTPASAYTVLQSDVETGSVANTASVAATPPSGEGAAGSVTDTDSRTVTIPRTPMLKIVKAAGGSPYVAGDTITYTFTVTNTGNVVVTGVGVDDPKLSGVTCTPTTLAPGAGASCTADAYTVTAADVVAGTVDNTAAPTGGSVAGTPAVDPSSTPSVSVELGTLPVAAPDAGTTPQNVTIDVAPLGNDTPGSTGGGSAGTLDATSVVFTSAAATDGGRTLVVAGQGTYTANPTTGVVTFDPEPAFTGAATPVTYRVTDSLGHSASSTIAITVTPVTPDAKDDAAATPYLTPVTVGLLDNDTAGASSAPLVPGSVVLTSPSATDGGRSLVVPGEGTYTIDPATGAATFTPVAGFAGPATPVGYRLADANGSTDTATLTVTVNAPPAPAAAPDTATTLQNVDVQLDPLANDTANGGATLVPSSVVFTAPSATNGGRTLLVPGEGTYTIDPSTGLVTFDPAASFSGPATPVAYRVSDDLGRSAASTIAITVTAVHPAATDDAALTPYLTPVDLFPLDNDAAGDPSAPLDPASLVFTSAAATDGGRTLVVAGEGTWTAAADATVTFTPVAGFSGPATPVTYRVGDANGSTASASLAVTVGTPPTATPDAGTTPQNVPVTLDPLTNDGAGSGGPVSGTLVASSVVFTSPAATDGGRTLVVPGEGTWAVGLLTGLVTFTPEPGFTGTATAAGYRVADSFGNTASSTVTITVTPVTPIASDDAGHTPFRTPVTVDVAGNDTAGAPSAPLVPGSVVLDSPSATDAGRTLVVAGEGTWAVNADGSITFTPEDGFSGPATPVGYRIADTNGTTAAAGLAVTVGQPPVANPDLGSTPQDVTVDVALLDNDTPGTDGAGHPGTLTASSVVFTAAAATDAGRTLVVPGEGTYRIDPATGTATFDPGPAFTGTTTPVAYRVTDGFGHAADSTLTVTVAAITPAAEDDTARTPYATPVTTPVLANDTAGAASAPLVPGTVVITTPGATDAGRTLVVAGQGTWTVEPGGSVRFVPADGFSGPASIAYQVRDANGTPATATLTVTVGAPPSASDDAGTTPQNVDVTLDPLGNDTPGTDGDGGAGTLDPASVVFASADATDGGRTLVVPGEGTWAADAATGRVTFDPEPAFTGAATPVDYEVTDSFGTTTGARITITVTPVVPVATADAATTPYRTPVGVALLGNDAAGAPSAPLVPATAAFTSAAATDGGRTLVVPGQGTYTLAADGTATFTPVTGFTGVASPVAYRVLDGNGTAAVSTLTITVTPPPAPAVADDAQHTPYRTTVSTSVLANDTAGGLAVLLPGSVVLTDPSAVNGGTTLAVAGEGTYQVNPDGTISFTPVAGFSGVAGGVDYQVSDELGQVGSARLVVTVGLPPVAADDSATTPQGVPVTLDPLANDAAGDNGAGTPGSLDPSSVVFTSASATDGGRTLAVPGEGTWTADPISGAVTFAPEPSFTGTTTPVGYALRDGFGNTATALETVTVAPVTPSAAADAATTPFGSPVTVPVLGNDAAGAASAPLVPGSVVLVDLAATDGGTRLAVAGEGSYEVNPDGTITFTPEPGFSGASTPVTYRVTDANGTTAEATLTVRVGTPPVAVDDAASTPHDTPVTLDPLGNDTAGDDGAGTPGTLDATSVAFTDPGASDGGHTLVVPGEGTWTIDPGTGAVTFDPEPGFRGTTTPATYAVTDSLGHTATAGVVVSVGAPTVAADDAATTLQNVTVTLCPPCNDTPGDDGAGTTGSLVAGSVVLTAPGATDGGHVLVVDGEGSWTIDPATGEASFDPEPGFTGTTTPAGYRITDSFGNTATADLTVTVTPVRPEAAGDSGSAPFHTPVTIDVLGNDLPGDDSAPLVPSSVVLTSPDATDGGRTLVVPGEGTWTVNADGSVTFTPESGFSGDATPVAYAVSDTNGEVAQGIVAAVIGSGPAASADQVRGTTPGAPVVVSVLGNDSGGTGCSLDPASLVLLGSDPAEELTILDVPGEGYWTVDAAGTLTFTPTDDFSGWASWATYRISDSCGNPVTAQARAYVPPQETAIDSESDGDGSLAHTGAEVGGLTSAALALLAGGVLLLACRRRREA